MRTVHRTFAWLLALLVLVSLLCPALAFAAEDPVQEPQSDAMDSDTDMDTDIDGNTDTVMDTDTAGDTNITGTGNTEIPGDTSQTDSDLQQKEDPVVEEKKETETGDSKETQPSANKTPADGSQAGDNTTVGSDEKKSQEGTISKAAGDGGTGGSLSSADGTQKQSCQSTVMELFISDKGSDETGDGTHEAPFATMNAALAFAGDSDVEIVLSLMTDLCLHETVPVVGNVVTVTGDDGGKKITRSEDFNAHFNPEEEHSTALFEVGTADPESNPGGSLLIEGIVIDEQFMTTDPLQDAVIEVYDHGKLILGDDAYILNYGGSSAIHGWSGSEVVVSDGAMILDQTLVEKNGTVAVQNDEGCTYSQGVLAIVLSHGESYDEVYGKHNEVGTDRDKDEETNTDAGVTDTTVVSTGNEGSGDKDTGNNSSGNDDTGNDDTGNDDIGNDDTGNDDIGNDDAGNDDIGNDDTDNDGAGNDDTGTKEDRSKDTSDDNNVNEDNSDLPSLKIQKKVASAGGTLGAVNDGGEALKEGNDSATGPSYSLDAPKNVSQKSTKRTINSYLTTGTVEGYEIPYTVSLNLGEFLGGASAIAAQTLTGADIELKLQLDALLYPETTAPGQNTVNPIWRYSFMSASAAYDSTTSTVNISLKADQDSLTGMENLASLLGNPLSLTVNTVVPSSTDFPQKASVTGTLTVTKMSFSTGNGNWLPNVETEAKTAITKLLDANKHATLVYDPNGGIGGPGTQELPAEQNHPLESANVPAHDDVNGKKVLFYGWTTEKDQHIYADGETAPSTVKNLTLEEENDPYHVYAVYSYDRNGDDIPDVDQKLLTLGFDGNAKNVTNEPGPITLPERSYLPGTAEFDIPEEEPVRKYYTFLGWSRDENATEASYKYDAPKAADRDITISKDTLLYAVWEANPVYTLYFDGNGGTNVPASQSAPSDNGIANLTITKEIPTRTGRTFVGWATQRYGTAAFDPGEAVKLRGGDVTLYAVWERNSSWSGSAPKTGDESNVPLYVLLAIAGAGGAYAVYRVLKKRGGSR